jgi:excisionase family DNA binding protein
VFLVDTAYLGDMSNEALLRTGEAATRLGVSRQHIVDMCNQGKLPCVTVGTHRRIPEQAVAAKIASVTGRAPRNDGVQQSLWLHAALIPYLVNEPSAVIEKARANLARGRAAGAIDAHSEPYAREWEAILDAGIGRIIATLLDPSQHAATLRSSTPFTGILTQDEVRAIKKAWREDRKSALAA